MIKKNENNYILLQDKRPFGTNLTLQEAAQAFPFKEGKLQAAVFYLKRQSQHPSTHTKRETALPHYDKGQLQIVSIHVTHLIHLYG